MAIRTEMFACKHFEAMQVINIVTFTRRHHAIRIEESLTIIYTVRSPHAD